MRGLPDYGINTYIQATNMVDMSQLYQGMTGIVSVDGLGRIVWGDNFGKGLNKMFESLYGNALASVLYARLTHSSGYCLKMNLGNTTGNGAVQRSVALIVPTDASVGIEASIYVDHNVPALYKVCLDYCYAPGASYFAYASYDIVSGDVSIYTPAGQVVIGNIPVLTQQRLWTPIKLVINTQTGKYVRAIVANQGFNLKQYDCSVSAQSIISGCAFIIVAYPRSAAGNDNAYYGHVIVTTDEP
jgi:hypothetical protein